MKLLFFINSLSCGGAERVTANLANYWDEKGWKVSIVTLASSKQDFYQLNPSVTRIALNLTGDSGNIVGALLNNLRRINALRRILKRLQPDIAIAIMTSANVLLAFAAWGVPFVATIGSEHTYPPMLPLGVIWERLRSLAYSKLKAVTALTKESAVWLKQYTNAKLVPIIPNPLLWPLPVQIPIINPAQILPDGKNVLLAVGRLSEEKQFYLLIDAFAKLGPDHTDWLFVILGEGPEQGSLEAQINALGLESQILLPGRVGNVGLWYQVANLYVMSSRFEGFPNCLVEAMGYGLPAVSFDCDTGPRDIIRHEVDGILVPPGDVVALTAALDRLMGNAVLRTRFAARSIEVRGRFSIERIAGMWEKLFEEIHK